VVATRIGVETAVRTMRSAASITAIMGHLLRDDTPSSTRSRGSRLRLAATVGVCEEEVTGYGSTAIWWGRQA
jgi:hypothetical protein